MTLDDSVKTSDDFKADIATNFLIVFLQLTNQFYLTCLSPKL